MDSYKKKLQNYPQSNINMQGNVQFTIPTKLRLTRHCHLLASQSKGTHITIVWALVYVCSDPMDMQNCLFPKLMGIYRPIGLMRQ